MQPVAKQEDGLRGRGIDCRQIGIVDAIQYPVKRRRNTRIYEERFRCGTVGRSGCRETVTIPQVAIEVVLEEWAPNQPANPKDHCPEEQAIEREWFVVPLKVQVEPEYRQAGP